MGRTGRTKEQGIHEAGWATIEGGRKPKINKERIPSCRASVVP